MASEMSQGIQIGVDWFDGHHGPTELAQTTGWLVIEINGRYATRNEDRWAKTVRSGVLVSGYPLALWLASSWWRLRSEVAPVGSPSISWRMAHELSAGGYGYAWPPIVFVSDGELVEVRCQAVEGDAWAPVSYLANFVERVGTSDFDTASREFIELVLARLDAVGVYNSDLQLLWRDLVSELAVAEASRWRSLEARFGFDPDEAPTPLPSAVEGLIVAAGPSAADEVASACAGDDALAKIDEAKRLAFAYGPTGSIPIPRFVPSADRVDGDASTPWDRGHELARMTRADAGLPGGPISDGRLCEMLGLRIDDLKGRRVPTKRLELGLAVRSEHPNRFTYVFRKARKEARRFEAARFLGDFLVAPSDDRWLPIADTKTARQKFQRAFAAELLMPIQELSGFMGDDFSSARMELAAEEFQTSPLAVRSHLANHFYIPQF